MSRYDVIYFQKSSLTAKNEKSDEFSAGQKYVSFHEFWLFLSDFSTISLEHVTETTENVYLTLHYSFILCIIKDKNALACKIA